MESVRYAIMPGDETEPFSFFLLNAWLQSRIGTGNETDGDEDVNIYISGVLARDAFGRYNTDNPETGLRRKGIDVEFAAESAETQRRRFEIYARNADLRLLNAGIYQDPEITGCGDVFYENAASALAGTRIRSMMKLFLDKLASGYDTYVEVLRHMKAVHLGLIERLSIEEMAAFQSGAQEAAMPYMKRLAYGWFADAYADARNATEPAARAEAEGRANSIAAQLRAIDPGFRFDGFQ